MLRCLVVVLAIAVLAGACGKIEFRPEPFECPEHLICQERELPAEAGTADAGVDGHGSVDATNDSMDVSEPSTVDAQGGDAGADAGSMDAVVVDTGVDTGVDAGVDNGIDTGVDTGIDAGPLDSGAPFIDYREVVKLTVTGPIARDHAPGSPDCAQWAFAETGDGPNVGGLAAMPYAFFSEDGASLWFAMSCKFEYGNGWQIGIAHWDPSAPTSVVWHDGDPVRAGINPVIDFGQPIVGGATVQGVKRIWPVFFGPGDLRGTASFYPGGPRYVEYALSATSATSITSLSLDPNPTLAFDPNPLVDAWATSVSLDRDFLRTSDGRVFVYSMYWDGSAMVGTRQSTIIGVVQTLDGRTAMGPTTRLADGWADPYVSEWGGSFHMVARQVSSNRYHYIRGASPTSFDFGNALPLYLHRFGGELLAWDEGHFGAHGGSNEPRIVSARVLGGTLYLFYLAGYPQHSEAVGYPSLRGGMGVLSVPLH